MVLKEGVKQENPVVATTPRQTEVPQAFEQGMKRKTKGFLFICIGLAVIALTGFAIWLGNREANPKISTQDQNIVNQVWGGKAPNAAEEKKIIDQVLNSQWPPVAGAAPVVAPVVVPPSVRSDFKAEYRETPSAKGKIELKFASTPADPGSLTYTVKNTSNKSLFIWDKGEEKDASGKILNRSGEEEPSWFLLKPGESTGSSRWVIKPMAKTLTMWVEVKDAQ